MKKATLTIGLFSLVMVATSFANPSTPVTSSNGQLAIVPPTDGSMAGHGRKQDYRMEEVAKTQSNFANVNQSIGGKKVD
ncbi:hypothetical protein SAMN05444397_10713 [Flavobacterium aquidurense]|uniref:Uncharacterized protein n=1 Tax=Flavobacterium frigidimaris TaxID=262320 RepID=A0ABX4BU77_FLAFR|nr:hypothetical protein [Flavobacterium frigidimaris]OXA81156.1 hypothetical protein B0A65_04410 [Flavobacterium frigidimaris]SDZ44950.1 hypothetical protein SAMN05444397_10713 [Flavobacterium aquidurense]